MGLLRYFVGAGIASSIISIIMPQPAYASACEEALVSAREKLNSVSDANVVDFGSSRHEYLEYPDDRVLVYDFTLENNDGAISVMNSPEFLTIITTWVIDSCDSIGVVDYGIIGSDWVRSYGIMDADTYQIEQQIGQFECLDPRIAPEETDEVPWGYQACL